jgi:hypothetical protein
MRKPGAQATSQVPGCTNGVHRFINATDNIFTTGHSWTLMDDFGHCVHECCRVSPSVSTETAGLPHVAQRGDSAAGSLDGIADHQQGEAQMIATAIWPSGKNEATDAYAEGQGPPTQAPEDHEPAHVVIAQMADLVRDTGGSTIADACILSAVSIGVAVETGLSAPVLRPGLAGVLNVGLLCALLGCWLAAVIVLAWASRPILNRVGQLRWVTGAPLDPRPGWVTLPPVGASPAAWTWDRAYLLLGAARLARHRMQFADTWTYVAGGCFLVWSAFVILGL